MNGTVRRRVVFGLIAAFATVAAACGSGGSTSTSTPAADTAAAGSTAAAAPASTAASTEPVTLTIDTFGDFGYKPLIADYVKAHPNVTVKEIQQEYNQHHQQLAQHLAAGSGAADIVAIDEGFIVQFRSTPDKWVNLLDLGAANLKDRWLPWKWAASMSADGKTQIGLGTDVGGLAMCYRKDLFSAAGLPTDRAAVSAMWPDWQSFISTGEKFQSANTGVKWVDSATNMLNPIIAQQPVGYFDTSDQLVFDSNPGVKTAWDSTMEMISKKESAGLAAFSPEWNAGFKQGKFATVACPAWMMGYIQDRPRQPKASGTSPRSRAAAATGAARSSPSRSSRSTRKAAYDLAAYLTAPEQELRVFKETGNLPSLPALYNDPALTAFTNPFFSDAPVGTIFSDTAAALKPQYLGTKNGPVRQAVENVVREVEAGIDLGR